jgi:hypothetical protein
MTPAEFEESYLDPEKRKPTLRNLTSLTTQRSVAQAFADGQNCQHENKTVSALTITVKTGRDISALSIQGGAEQEWILLPGTKLETVSIKERETGKAGPLVTTKRVLVERTEV